jgi:hypothetical protein
MKFQKLIDFF